MDSKSQIKKDIGLVDSRLVISVKEARKLLGSSSRQMTDNDIEKMIISMSRLAKSIFQSSI